MSLPDGTASRQSAAPDSRSTTILDRLVCCIETISLGFERWDDIQAKGPGLYFVLAQESLEHFAEPMGTNRWPIESCPDVYADSESLLRTARSVAFSRDGAVVVYEDGTFGEEMVRLAKPSPPPRGRSADLPYAGWMGARHMSALETSARETVNAALTLSEEDGRMTVFRDGEYQDYPRSALRDGDGICD